jgi:hypothetical protein
MGEESYAPSTAPPFLEKVDEKLSLQESFLGSLFWSAFVSLQRSSA